MGKETRRLIILVFKLNTAQGIIHVIYVCSKEKRR
jgi:hypothetical protein